MMKYQSLKRACKGKERGDVAISLFMDSVRVTLGVGGFCVNCPINLMFYFH